ncbi:hypothetical protein D3C81_1984390 [compost metagenome]
MSAVCSDDRNIIRYGTHSFIVFVFEDQLTVLFARLDMPPEPHLHLFVFPSYFPYVIILQPVIGQLHLIPVNDFLLEEAVFITYATAVSCILQGSQ